MSATTKLKMPTKPKLAFSAPAAPDVVPAPRSMMRVLGILHVTAQTQSGLTLAALSAQVGAPKSSLLMLLRTLVAEGYLMHSNALYEIGPHAYRLASDILSGRRFPKMIRPYMQEVVDRTQESVILAVLDREAQMASYIEVVESPRQVRYTVPAGTSRPLYASTAGRVLLAYQDDAWRKAYFAKTKLKSLTSHTVTDRDSIKAELEKIRVNGYAVVKGQTVEDAAGISAPIMDADGTVVAALTVGCPADRLDGQKAAIIKILLDVTSRACGVFRQRAAETPPARRRAKDAS